MTMPAVVTWSPISRCQCSPSQDQIEEQNDQQAYFSKINCVPTSHHQPRATNYRAASMVVLPRGIQKQSWVAAWHRVLLQAGSISSHVTVASSSLMFPVHQSTLD